MRRSDMEHAPQYVVLDFFAVGDTSGGWRIEI
jgi:hypothetical protein